MLPNSFGFLFFFLVVSVLYYTVPHRWRWGLLLLASFYFYSSLSPKYVLLLVYSIVAAYGTGLVIARLQGTRGARIWLIVGLLAQFGVLFLYKYTDFFFASLEGLMAGMSPAGDFIRLPRLDWLLPAGLSFFTFSSASYVIDVYRGTIDVQRHLGKLALYIAFFPKLLAGPIERAKSFLDQLSGPTSLDPRLVSSGLQLMLWGLVKKTVIADNLADFVNNAFQTPAFQNPITLIIAVYLYAFQIYCDFSGYSDIAIGGARVLGIQLMANFKRPYLAKSVAEFWSQRWHISLSRWFRDYLYIPLGGSRVPWFRIQMNLMIVFLVSGLWHGANWTFVIWGALNGLYQVIFGVLRIGWERLSVPWRPPAWLSGFLNTIITFHLITLSWVFFRSSSVQEAWMILTRISSSVSRLPMILKVYNWGGKLPMLGALVGVLLLAEILDERRPVRRWLAAQPAIVRWALYYATIAVLLTLGKWGFEDFVYMQF